MKTRRTVLLVLVAVSSIFSACKKDHDKGRKPDCRVKSVTVDRTGGGSTWDFKYGSDGKVTTITLTHTGGVTITEFTYTGNTILTVSTSNGSYLSRDSLTVDSKGRPVNIRNYSTSGAWQNIACEYNGEELSKLTQTTSTSTSSPKTSVATYSNGNLVSLVSPTNTVTYEYFPEETQVADYQTINSYVDYGLRVFPHKNLLKSLTGGGSTTTVTYEKKNADGLITNFTAIAAGSELKYSIEYECN